jgi:hypothetical protein
VNPSNLEAQAMSGIGVGTEEMGRAVMEGGDTNTFKHLLNDLRNEVGYVIYFDNTSLDTDGAST